MLLSKYPRFYIDKPIRLIELFAGIGAQSKALRRIGVPFQNYKVCELDPWSIKSYNAIHETDFVTSDIRDWKSSDLGIVDTDRYCYIMTYTFPCQDLSSMGKGMGMLQGSDTRSSLLWEVQRLLGTCQQLPQVLIMENVVQVHGEKNLQEFSRWISFLKGLGYSNYYKDLNAKDFDCPQDRKRCFMVSVLGNFDYVFPKGRESRKSWLDLLEPKVSEDFYSDFRLDTQNSSAANSRGIDNAKSVLRRVGSDRVCPLVWDDYNSSMRNDQSCFGTLTTNCGNRAERNGFKIIEPNGSVRVPTPLEVMRLMSFEDSDYYKIKDIVPRNKIYQQVGNSICVNILEDMVRKMLGACLR